MTDFQNIIGYQFKDPQWLDQALSHKSYVNELRKGFDNEKLEFIGDAVIDLVLAEALYHAFPKDNEGDLSKKRASLVNELVLHEISQELQVSKFLKLGKGEIQTGGETRPRLLASAVEAIIGAVYMDSGFVSAHNVIMQIFKSRLEDEKLSRNYEQDFKSRLQEFCQKKYKEAPTYKVVEERGAPHDRVFVVDVSLKDKVMAQGEGKSKKEAEQKAAEKAIKNEEAEG